ncbi:hypothetical protein [Bacteroides heparinolyticus]|uniref:hypothetical protein n=1 Tax=Prevotella heparinolytica TaxID=28113 RepID=UPI0023F31536|nr:hypothetical protein [Bacteroides heparinolyticus]
MKKTLESASLEYFNKNSKYRPEMEEVIRTAFEAGAEWKEQNLNNQQKTRNHESRNQNKKRD